MEIAKFEISIVKNTLQKLALILELKLFILPKERRVNSCSLVNKLDGSPYITCYISYTNKWVSFFAHHILKLLGGQQSWKSLLPIHAIDCNKQTKMLKSSP